ncbi:hypothetical protein CQA49_09745 [Helicobacter sp. MIT 00-7814]|uniref:DUF5131 family protein n=1 Tax=unclassified Helicobacter TaxID=2593540 RepID=UPI000E1F5CB0|nr:MULTISPECIES: DUF5131 family protein [unclassified Helicobacter]RDU51309.1 hypothetical protein CQA49_09745 [Helicobacter sp. MIT 00-7814]RDU51338.1 hypothetical protein CQA37_09780 [Helicobacter sp. MIT 99-10781]
MSKIEWCDKTWNVITGCSGISEACRNCYARTMHKRLHEMYKKNPTQKGVQKYSQPFDKVVFHEDMLDEILDTKKYPSGSRIFVNSMSDTFHLFVEHECQSKIFNAIKNRPDCDFLFLTKRVWRMFDMCLGLGSMFEGMLKPYPQNILFGATIENQEQVKRITPLIQIKKVKKSKIFISCEPLLSELHFGEDLKHIDWVIVGGEKIPNAPKRARPMKKEWVEKLYSDCRKAGVPFFFKQWGNAPRESKSLCEFETCKEFYKGGAK